MNDKEINDHKIEVIQEIRNILEDIEKETNKWGFHIGEISMMSRLNNLLCRVGELESTMLWQNDKKYNPKAEPKNNRLCTCYDTGEREYWERLE